LATPAVGAHDPPQRGQLTYAPVPLVRSPRAFLFDFATVDTFQFTVSDGAVTSAPATVIRGFDSPAGETVFGTSGNDIFFVAANSTVFGEAGKDFVQGTENLFVSGGVDADRFGLVGKNAVQGGEGADVTQLSPTNVLFGFDALVFQPGRRKAM
jgi:hypothetical protein